MWLQIEFHTLSMAGLHNPNDGEGKEEQVFPQGFREPWLMGGIFWGLKTELHLGKRDFVFTEGTT